MTVWLTVFEFATTYDLINLAHTSEHLRSLVFLFFKSCKFSIYFEWANGFCDSKQWYEITNENFRKLIMKLYDDLDENFDFNF